MTHIEAGAAELEADAVNELLRQACEAMDRAGYTALAQVFQAAWQSDAPDPDTLAGFLSEFHLPTGRMQFVVQLASQPRIGWFLSGAFKEYQVNAVAIATTARRDFVPDEECAEAGPDLAAAEAFLVSWLLEMWQVRSRTSLNLSFNSSTPEDHEDGEAFWMQAGRRAAIRFLRSYYQSQRPAPAPEAPAAPEPSLWRLFLTGRWGEWWRRVQSLADEQSNQATTRRRTRPSRPRS